MAYKKLTVTEDHIRLLQAIKFETFTFDGLSNNGRIGWGIDQYSPWGGTTPIEDIALILGHWQDAIHGTEEDFDGRKFPEPLMSHFYDLYEDITENMEYYWSLLIWSIDKGGLTEGVYKCHPRYKDWEKEEKII